VIAVRGRFVFLGLDDLNAVFTHQTTYTPLPDVQSQFVQLFGHAWPAITLQVKAMLLSNIRQNYHIVALFLAHWANPPCKKATRGDTHNTAQKLNRPFFFPGVDKDEPHRLWPAKKIAIVFNTSLA
jgi:hypothetical protein